MDHPNFIITGGPGSGKSTLINALEDEGYFVFHEVARKVIKEQLALGTEALPWKDNAAFSRHTLAGMKGQFPRLLQSGTKFLDRGIPDIISYLHFHNNPVPADLLEVQNEAPYNKTVFFTPFWKEIFASDTERIENEQDAIKIGDIIKKTYTSLGYHIIVLPEGNIINRVEFIKSTLKNITFI